MASTAFSMPFFSAIGFAPAATLRRPFANQGLGQHGGRGGAVTGDIVGLLGNFLDELGPDLLVRVLELDFLGDRHTIVGDGGRAPLLLQDDVAAARPQGHPDGVGEDVHPALEPATRFLVESDQLGHEVLILQIRRSHGRCGPVVRSAALGMVLAGGGARDGRTVGPAAIGGPGLADSHRTDLALRSPECQLRFSTLTAESARSRQRRSCRPDRRHSAGQAGRRSPAVPR